MWDREKEAWMVCACLLSKRFDARLRLAGVPLRFRDQTWREYFRHWTSTAAHRVALAARALSEGSLPPRWFLLYSEARRARNDVAGLLARSACEGNLTTKLAGLPELIDADLGDETSLSEYLSPQVLVLNVGDEPRHKWNKVVLEKALNDRWNAGTWTALVSSVVPERLDVEYGSELLADVWSDWFTVAEVSRA